MSPLNVPIGFSVLLVYPSPSAGEAVARALKEHGFSTHLVASAAAARVVARWRYYRAVVLVTDLWHGRGLAELATLRASRPRTWILVASPNAPPDELANSLRYLADALLIGPLSIEELVSRLLAFSMRPRPL